MLNKLLEDGNTLFKRNKVEDAAHRYSYALRRIPVNNNNVEKAGPSRRTRLAVEDDSRGETTTHEALFYQLRTHLLLNLSKCQRKMGDWEGAVESASAVIDEEATGGVEGGAASPHLTALHARAKAYKEAGQLERASADLSEALRLSPNNRDLHKMILQVKDQLRAEEEGAIGANNVDSEDIKYLDETASEVGSALGPATLDEQQSAVYSVKN